MGLTSLVAMNNRNVALNILTAESNANDEESKRSNTVLAASSLEHSLSQELTARKADSWGRNSESCSSLSRYGTRMAALCS